MFPTSMDKCSTRWWWGHMALPPCRGKKLPLVIQDMFGHVPLPYVLWSLHIINMGIGWYFLLFVSLAQQPRAGYSLLIPQGFVITHDTPVGRTPLDEWLARPKDLYLTTHDRQTSMPLVGFERTTAVRERPLGPASMILLWQIANNGLAPVRYSNRMQVVIIHGTTMRTF
jgi:hypothetical protein